MFFEGTSDTFTRKPSEVQCFLRVSPTLLQGNRRRSIVFRGYLRHFYKETVGGPMFFEGTSDTFTRKLSEVQCFLRVSPTLLQGNRRRSNVFRGYLRHFCRETVGGPVSCLTFKGFVHISQTVSQMLNLMRLAMIQDVEQQYLRFRSEEQKILYATPHIFIDSRIYVYK